MLKLTDKDNFQGKKLLLVHFCSIQ